jgi:hypothetical protein
MAATDSDIRVADDPNIDLVAVQTEDGDMLFYDPTLDEGAADGGRWMRADPESCVDLGASH